MKWTHIIAAAGISGVMLYAGTTLAEGTANKSNAQSQSSQSTDSTGETGSAGQTAPIAGSAKLGVAVEQVEAVAIGWSAKKSILGKSVYNDKGEKIGKIDDVIITPDNALSFAILGTGGFVGLSKHNVAIPVEQIKKEGERLVLSGATKESVKALPKFEYTRS